MLLSTEPYTGKWGRKPPHPEDMEGLAAVPPGRKGKHKGSLHYWLVPV